MSEERQTCIKCGKTKVSKREFFKMKNGERHPMCKDCLTMHIDNRDPKTFYWILEEFDVPYIEDQWISLSNKIYAKNPAKFGPRSVIGQYIRTMNMSQYAEYSFRDTDRLNAKSRQQKAEAEGKVVEYTEHEEEYEAELKAKLEAGEISESEYRTLSPKTDYKIGAQMFTDYIIDNEAAVEKQLTDEDRQYLISKWGYTYKPSEWVTMETMYQKYVNEYDMNADREETLKSICKVSLKMNQSIDVGDHSSAKAYASMIDQLRKSGKFTEAQNKEQKHRELDSIGELVKLCELEGGIIDKFPDPYEYPQDKIDFTIKDIQNYLYNLVTKEYGLGDLIESYIQKLEKKEEIDALEMDAELITSREEEEANALTNEEAQAFQEYQAQLQEEDNIIAEAEELLEKFGEEHPHES